MKLELASFPVNNVRFGKSTNYNNGVLQIHQDELLALLLKDKRITGVTLDLGFPNDETRIVNIRDVVQPIVKVSGPGCVFPGIVGPVETAGRGRTHKLSGIAVIPTAHYRSKRKSGGGAQNIGILDMWGPGSLVTHLGSTINVVLMLKLMDDLDELEAEAAILKAECVAAQYLAESTRHIRPEKVEVFELFEVDSSLPRVVYILGFVTNATEAHSGVTYYGMQVKDSLPTFIHPNEILDGALTTDARKGRGIAPMTWGWMNNPVVLGLYKEHGKRLNFLGVILQKTRFESEFGKQVLAASTSQLASLLRANGAIITRTEPSGNNMIDVMLTIQACERRGIKTVHVGPEWGGRDGTEVPLVFTLPEADAIVTTGSMDRVTKVPAPKKVIGLEKDQRTVTMHEGDEPIHPWNELILDNGGEIPQSIYYFGEMNYTCKGY